MRTDPDPETTAFNHALADADPVNELQPRWISRSELARQAKVTRAAVTQACRNSLSAACDPAGHIDLEHPAAVAYLARNTKSPRSGVAKSNSLSPEQQTAVHREVRRIVKELRVRLDAVIADALDEARFGS